MKYKPCPNCDGFGMILTGDNVDNADCDECGGSGEIEDDEEEDG